MMDEIFLRQQEISFADGTFGASGKLIIKAFSIPDDQREIWLREFLRWVDVRIDGCWEWRGRIHKHKKYLGREGYKGYPTISTKFGSKWAHRVSYALFKGPIAEGMHIDHRCRNTICVRPSDLIQVTPIENYLAIYRRKRRDKLLKLEERQLVLWE